MKKVFILMFILLRSPDLLAQDSTGARQEGWPELDVFYKLNAKWRLYAMYSATKLKNSDFTDGGIGVYGDYFGYPSIRQKLHTALTDSTDLYHLWVRVGYYYSTTPRGAEKPVKENTITTEANSRVYLPLEILLTIKNRVDWRFMNGDFNPRYRARLNFERDMHTDYLYFTPYFYGEYFANLNVGNSNRFRLCLGTELKASSIMNFELYFLHQFQNRDNVDELNAVGIALKFYLDEHNLQKAFSKKGNKKQAG